MKKTVFLATSTLLISATVSAASRDYIQIVGSSTVYPYSTAVAERFGKGGDFKTPKVESTGTGGGAKLFCSGVGLNYPDITNASRAIKDSERELCASNGVTDIIEVIVGYDGISFANALSGPALSLSSQDLYLATAAQVPDPEGSERLVDNPYQNWSDIRADLPVSKIEVLGPPPSSGTRDAWAELAMEDGCKTYPWIKDMAKSDKKQFKNICHSIREDGAYIETGENDNLIIQKLIANDNAFGIFGFSFLDQNTDVVRGAVVDSIEPTFDTIADGSYPISRPLYFYVKKAHIGVVPGLEEFLNAFISESASGDDGYLGEKGLVPLQGAEREAMTADIKALKTMQ